MRVTYLYAIELSSGVVKLGRSTKPKDRFRVIPAYFARSWGRKPYARVVRSAVYPMATKGYGAYLAEQAMLERAARLGTVVRPFKEYFTGLDFGAAANLARQIAPREFITASGA